MLTEDLSGSDRYRNSLLRFQLQLFAFMWAAATLFHQVQFDTLDNKFHYFLLTLAAIAVLLKPSSIIRLVVLICLQLNESFINLPEISNHWALVTLVNLTIIQVLLYIIWKNPSTGIHKPKLFDSLVKVIRAEVIIFYFFVVFHKINSAFLNPDVSCATDFIIAQNYSGMIPSRGFLQFNAWFTLLIEAIIPLFLMFRSTRVAGLLTGLLFHIIIAYNPLNGFYDFSSTILALYVFFLPQDLVAFLYKKYRESSADFFFRNLSPVWIRFVKTHRGMLLTAASLVLVCLILVDLTSYIIRDFYRYIIWTVYSLGTVVMLVYWIMKKEKNNAVQPFNYSTISHWSFMIIPAILFLNGICPYLGLKTEYSFAMFSNLRTEGGISNHYLIPASVQLFDYQKDLVEILGSSDEILQDLGKTGKLITYFELKETFQKRKIKTLRYIRSGETHEFDADKNGKNHDLIKANPLLLRKFLDFRVISKNEPQPCSH